MTSATIPSSSARRRSAEGHGYGLVLSAGAVVGAVVAADASAAELEEIMRAVEYRRFQDGPRWRNLFLGKAVAVLFEQGIYEGQYLRDWLGERLGKLGVCTFAVFATSLA